MKDQISGFLIFLEAAIYGLVILILGPFVWFEEKCKVKSLATYGMSVAIVLHVIVAGRLLMWGMDDDRKALTADILKAQYRETLGGLLDEEHLRKIFDFIGI